LNRTLTFNALTPGFAPKGVAKIGKIHLQKTGKRKKYPAFLGGAGRAKSGGGALKPLKQPPFLDPEVNAVFALLHGIRLEPVPVTIGLAPILEIELHGMHRTDHPAGTVDITVQHRRAGMGTVGSETIQLVIELPNTDRFAIDFKFGDVAGYPIDIGHALRDLVPFVTLDKAH
jgi:hypothetical protein